MDADDVMHSNRLEEQYKFLLKNKDYGLVSSCVRYRNESKTKEGLGFQKYVEWANKIQSNSQISLSRFEESPTLIHRLCLGRKYSLNMEATCMDNFPKIMRFGPMAFLGYQDA